MKNSMSEFEVYFCRRVSVGRRVCSETWLDYREFLHIFELSSETHKKFAAVECPKADQARAILEGILVDFHGKKYRFRCRGECDIEIHRL